MMYICYANLKRFFSNINVFNRLKTAVLWIKF